MTNTLDKIIHNGDEYEFPSGDVLVSDQANNIFTPGMKIWGGTKSDYQSLTPESNTAYLLLADQPTPPSPSNYTITGSTTVGSFTPSGFTDPQGFYINPDGDIAYMTFWNGGTGKMSQYSLSTPRDISTASETQNISVTKPNGLCFSDDGEYMFLSTENGNKIIRYSLSTAWDISTASVDSGQELSIPSDFALNVSLSGDGRYIRFGNWTNIYQYELTTPYDLTSATNQKSFTSSDGTCVQVKNDGKYLYSAGSDGNIAVKQFELATANDITSTRTEIGSYSLTIGEGRCLFVSNDCKYWMMGNTSGGITQYEAQPMS